eukprot:scaffold9991_cov139-Skeletonema_dohrnii-CCMP3373.AAC.2
MPSNNGTPTSTIGGESLSPSNESRFVPRSSLYASPTSASKRHVDADDNNVNPPNLIDDEDDKSLIVGATICFTPDASPRNTPLKAANHKRSALDLTTLELESALSSNATDEYIGSIIDGSKVSSSNVIQTTSSLDGKSTTEYEILDKSLEIEDLNLGEEEEEDDANEGNGGANMNEVQNIDGDVAAILENMSPTSSLPSLGSRAGEDEDVGEDTKLEVPTQLDDDGPDNVSTSSPKVDDRPLTPFNNLHKFWEGQSITNMSKTIMGLILMQETAPDPVGAHAMDGASLKSDEVHATPAKKSSRLSAGKGNGSLCSVAANRVFSCIVSVVVMIGLMTRRCASSTLNAAKYCAQVLLRKDVNVAVNTSATTKAAPSGVVMSKLCAFAFSALSTAKDGLQAVLHKKNTMAVDPEGTDEHPAAQALVATPSKSNLFSDEPLPTGVSQLCSKEVETDASGDADAAAEPLDMKELERLRKINSWALYVVATISKMKSTMLQFVVSLGGRFFLSFLLAFIVMAELRMFQRYNVSPKDVVAWETLLCVDNGSNVFDSVPMWEYILSPTSFGAASSKPSNYWGLIYIGMSILASALFAHWSMKMPYNSGHWNENEHHQFLKGYKKHGKDWEAVAKYVLTRSLKQVKNHGNYWLHIRSPGKSHPFSPKAIKVKKEGFVSPRNNTPMSDPVRRVKVLHSPLTGPVRRAKMRLLDKGGQDTSEE